MYKFKTFFRNTGTAALIALGSLSVCQAQAGRPGYVKGDFHQHTTYTDGSNSIETLFYMNNKYGLDWWANSEHGGSFATDASGALLTAPPFDKLDGKYYDAFTPNPILGRVVMSGSHQAMWRWQSLRDYSFKDVIRLRSVYSNRVILQSYEMNVPSHEHCSMGLIANQFTAQPNCAPIAEFEFKYDANDSDTTGGNAQGWSKSAASGHAKAVEAAAWLQTNYTKQSYLVYAHPERKKLYTVSDFRDFNNAGPDVAFGFESMPGHQKSSTRGEYSKTADGAGTYGGCGIYAAKVGGMWDALLGEGRRFWLFASSDCHAVGTDAAMSQGGDFWPGEYQKNFTYVSDRSSAQAIIDGLRSGNTFVVIGDLIDSLNFTVNSASMGQFTQIVNGGAVVNIVVRDPQGANNNTYSSYTNPVLDHIDLIAGSYGSKFTPGTAEYSSAVNNTTKVIARFDAVGGVKDANGITSIKWNDLGNGLKQMSFTINNMTSNTYFRLRGTNQGLNVPNETDANGNPLSDTLITNSAAAAFADLWFYSNPVFVSASPTVPVEMESFGADCGNGSVVLKWATATETNNKGFEIEKSRNNKSWNNIGFVTGNGTTANKIQYSYTDNSDVAGVIYYRIKQIDFDGAYKYSKVIQINANPLSFELGQNYPNPFNPSTTISYSLPKSSRVTLKVFDMLGKEVATLIDSEMQAGRYKTEFNSTLQNGKTLSSGVYIYKLQAEGFSMERKMLMLK
jgi:hypothetical protein